MIQQFGRKFLTTPLELAQYHLTPEEIRCKCGCGKMMLLEETAASFAHFRAMIGAPIPVLDGCRCVARQEALVASGAHAAKNGANAPHVLATALDLEVVNGYTQQAFAERWLKSAGGQLRVGWAAYPGQGFIHGDKAFLIQPNPDPVNYQPGVTW